MLARGKLRDGVVDALLRRIRDEGLRPGDALPPERQLSEELGVSRTVVREGMTALEMQGVLELVPGRRPRVVHSYARAFADTLGSAVSSDPQRLAELVELRRIFEPEAAALAASRASADDLRAMDDAIRAMSQDLDLPSGYVDADIAFHEALVAAAHNSLLAQVIQPMAALSVDSRRASAGTRRPPADALAEHRAILDAVAAADPEAARIAAAKHLLATAEDLGFTVLF